MSSGCRNALAVSALLALCLTTAKARELRVCADPNNLPFSNARLEGFENKIVELIARELDATAQYTWWAQRRGFVRNTLNAESCDLVSGTTVGPPTLRPTAPYYRSTYVFVRRAGLPDIASLDDPALRDLKIGVHLIGDDGFNVPAAHALARRGILANVRGYPIYGDYRQENPSARLIDAVATGEIDVAIAWGPLGGYFAALQEPPLRVTPVLPAMDGPLPMTYAITMGVRRKDEAFQHEIDAVLGRKRTEIDGILARFSVPRAESPDTAMEIGR
jgi:mxaJ protein